MGFLDELQQPGHQRRRDYEQFSKKYDKGSPEDGYDDEEVARRYHEVAQNVDEPTYRKAAKQALSKMKPQQRRQFGQALQQQARQHGNDIQYDGKSTDPGVLAGLTSQLHQQDPGLLGQLLGAAGGGGGIASALGGSGGGGAGGVVGSLLGGAGGGSASKGVLAGIASYATKSLMNR